MMTLATRLRYVREAAGLSQSALARAASLRPQTVQAIESGRVQQPRALIELARILEVRAEWLLWGEGAMEEPGVHETAGEYRRMDVPALSREAQGLAQDWMSLPRGQRAAVKEMVRALRTAGSRAPRRKRRSRG